MAIVQTTISTSDPNYIQGRNIMYYFHWYNQKAYPSVYKIASVDALIKSYGAKGPILAQGLGKTFKVSGDSIAKAQAAMQKLSKDSKGKVPTWQAFSDYLSGQLSQRDYFQMAQEVAVNSAKSIASGVMETGESVLTAARISKYIIAAAPIIMLGLVVLFVYKKGSSPLLSIGNGSGSSGTDEESIGNIIKSGLKSKARKMFE